jgi:hypothetical protein
VAATAGVVWYESKRLDQTHVWHRDYVQLPFWHRGLGAKKQNYCGLYVLLSLRRPEVGVGWWAQPVRGKTSWDQAVKPVADYLQTLAQEFDVGPGVDWREPFEPLDMSALTATWVADSVLKGGWIRVQRTIRVEAVRTSDPVTALLLGFADSLATEGRPVLDALAADRVLDLGAEPETPPDAELEDEDAPAE